MDIAAISTILSQQKIAQQASVSVMKMAMNTAEQRNTDLIRMMDETTRAMEASVMPHLGTNIDIKL